MKSLVIIPIILASNLFASSPTLIGGRQVMPGEYPEVIRISSNGSSCSAAVVGPRAVLTAAHCTTDKGDIKPISEREEYQFILNQNVYRARCLLAPSYRDGERGTGSEDIALCKTDRIVEVKYASVSLKSPRKGKIATLIGYGCTREGGSGGNDGILRVGQAPIIQESTDSNHHYYAKGNSALCYGDSGGPAFKQLRDPKNQHHIIEGVNSMGNIKDLSLLTDVSRSIDFLRDFERQEGVEICGLSRDCNDDDDDDDDGGDDGEGVCEEEIFQLTESVKRLAACLAQ